jgi:hypothetical protein
VLAPESAPISVNPKSDTLKDSKGTKTAQIKAERPGPSNPTGTLSGQTEQYETHIKDRRFPDSPETGPKHEIAPASIMDPDFELVMKAWPDLPDALRQGILAMVRSVRRGRKDERS